jgi:protein arginine kinase activator
MKLKCQQCQREATVHLTDIINGQKIEKHLCQQCAAAEHITAQGPLTKLLEDIVLQSAAEKELSRVKCDICGMGFLEFQQNGLLGCPNDYQAFRDLLVPLLERAHEGASTHAGKVPANAEADERRQSELLRLRGQLKQAVADEDYERAAQLRDGIKELEGP